VSYSHVTHSGQPWEYAVRGGLMLFPMGSLVPFQR
jgi:transcription-repair coupling factor (superfamily II helicase)